MEHKPSRMDKFSTICNSWPIKIAAGFGMAFLIKVLTDSNIAAVFLGLAVFWALVGILHNNPIGWKKWVSILILIGTALAGILTWWIKYQPTAPSPAIVAESPKHEQSKENQLLILQPLIIPQETKPPMQLIEIDPNQLNLTTILRNNTPSDIYSDVNVWLGIFQFPEGIGHIKWIKSDNKSEIRSGGIGTFSVNFLTINSHFVVMAAEGREFPNGILLDESNILYSWKNWHNGEWARWHDNKHNVDESVKMEILLDKFKDCAHAHSIDRNYSACFKD